MRPSPHLLNLGCGAAFHPEWVNLDAFPVSPDVIAHDLHRRLPFSDGSFDAVYGSHVLEHLEPDAAMRLLHDCHRILRPAGIVRMAVPDLEAIVKLYLESLVGAISGDTKAVFNYDWAMLELYDQAVRSVPGGKMRTCIAGILEEHEARFIKSRIGDEASCPAPAMGRATAGRWLWHCLHATAEKLRSTAAVAATFLLLGSRGAAALREGLFRNSGEVHRWMYDRYSLKRALERAGYGQVRTCVAGESRIPGFPRFELELKDGKPRKPDSIYVEGYKLAVA